MERFLMRDLEAWRENPCRKPLIINGARQVGKTWLIKEFGRRHYESVAYVNMDNNAAMRELFDTGYDIDVLIAGLQLQTGVTIEPDSTLIVFDKVQENPKALTALKYFDEDPRGFSVVAAGSLLGILLQSGTGFPVGKVEALDLYPLSFEEFALAAEGEQFLASLQNPNPALIQAFKSRAIALLKTYYFVGGMTHGPFRSGSSPTTSATSPSTSPPARPNGSSPCGTPSSLTYPKRTRSSSSAASRRAPGRRSSRAPSRG